MLNFSKASDVSIIDELRSCYGDFVLLSEHANVDALWNRFSEITKWCVCSYVESEGVGDSRIITVLQGVPATFHELKQKLKKIVHSAKQKYFLTLSSSNT